MTSETVFNNVVSSIALLSISLNIVSEPFEELSPSVSTKIPSAANKIQIN